MKADRKKCPIKGSMTVEAAIALPVFLCVVISMVMLTRVVYTHSKIQHALTETAGEMASASYIYHISGLRDLHDAVRNGIQERADIFEGQMDSVFDVVGGFGGGTDAGGAAQASGEQTDILKNIASYLLQGSFEDAKTGLFTPLVRFYMGKYLAPRSGDTDAGLRALGVSGGFAGLDFSGSTFFGDSDENIDIIVRYTIDLPVPIHVFPRLELVQRATVRGWLAGDESTGVLGGEGVEEDIWSLDNFTRGSKLRTIFGGNLPYNFPVISAFDRGKAVIIKSMDLTADSYQDVAKVRKTVDSYIKDLAGYQGQETPWGSKGIVIRKSDIGQRELLLVIPQNQLSGDVERLLAELPDRAEAAGVVFRLERYGTKAVKTD